MIITGSDIGMESERIYSSTRREAITHSRSETSLSQGSFLDALKNVSKVNNPSNREQDMLDKIREQCFNFLLFIIFGKDFYKRMMQEQGGMSGISFNVTTVQETYSTYESEQETTSFDAKGIVRTKDGREIDFNIEMMMSRSFEQYFEDTEQYKTLGLSLMDPLVINLDGNIADVSDQKFMFDLDADGNLDEMSMLGAGSGFLALDLNEDGIINDGNELFGVKSGNGFYDLAKYDSDGNGWIDEADEIFDKLKIFCINADGTQTLYQLKDKDIGAIYLGSANTDFSLKSLSDNELNAQIRKTGLFLYESGNVGTVQHVDMAVNLSA